MRPTGEAAAFQAVPGEFDSRSPLHARAVQWLNAGLTCRRSLVRFQPRVPRRVLPDGKEPGLSNRTTRVRLPYTTLATPSSNGSGSEITNLRMVVRVHPESPLQAAIWDHIGFQVRSAGFDSSTACEHGKQLTWWWGRFHTPNVQGSIPWLATTTASSSPGVIAVSRTAGAGFDSLARHHASR